MAKNYSSKIINLNFRSLSFLLCFSFFPFVGFSQPSEATISEEQRSLKTYPFSNPDPVTILTSNPKIYPYFRFDDYSHEGTPKDWKVVKLENDFIEVTVMPEAGGKVWGAIEKSSGEEFIYRNEVMKFRNISMRGPWTSGGIEFNFGIIGHHPSTATPVDYILQKEADGSVSCTVGNIDLPSRTQWRVKIILPKDKAYFETEALWYNPTPLHQSYYNWMTAAAFAQEDLKIYTPGNQYLKHSGESKSWPLDEQGRDISSYKENNFGPSKSYHVVGEYNDFFGGYFENSNYGFGHWSEYDDMPGQKMWLWALSRSGGIWEDLLTDTDGQYIEFQAGRLTVQYSPGTHVNPVSQTTFEPYSTDSWREVWFPVKEIGGMSEVSPSGILHVTREGDLVNIGINSLSYTGGTLEVSSDEKIIHSEMLQLQPMQVIKREIKVNDVKNFKVKIPQMDLYYSSDLGTNRIKRPFESSITSINENSAEKEYQEALEEMEFREFSKAMDKFKSCLKKEPLHRGAMTGLAELFYIRGQYERGLEIINKALRIDTYDPDANFVAGILYRASGDLLNAKESFGWAARSMKYRSSAYAQMAEVLLTEKQFDKAATYAQKALDYNRFNINALEVLIIQSRKKGDKETAYKYLKSLLDIDPLNHFAYFEHYLLDEAAEDKARFISRHQSEFPYQTYLELAIDYYNKRLNEEAIQVLEFTDEHPLIKIWLTFLKKNSTSHDFESITHMDPDFVFPFRQETLEVLKWANDQSDHWKLNYYLALNYWGMGCMEEAAKWMKSCKNQPDFPAFYVARAGLLKKAENQDELADLAKALELGGEEWRYHHSITKYYLNSHKNKEALAIAEKAYAKFPNNYTLGMNYAQVLLNVDRYAKSKAILEKLNVLPFEGASEGRKLYEQAHLQYSLELMKQNQFAKAIEVLESSKEWPENLGVGKPYDPEVRLANYLLASCYLKQGKSEKANTYYQQVVNQTKSGINEKSLLHLLGLKSLALLKNSKEAESLLTKLKSGQFADSPETQWVIANYSGESKKLATLKPKSPKLWDQMEMKILEKVLQFPFFSK